MDETAMLAALDGGKLYGVGLDVYPDEPNVNPELFKRPNVTLLPHMGTEYVDSSIFSVWLNLLRTWDSRDKMALIVLDNILACLKDEPLPNIVPEHK